MDPEQLEQLLESLVKARVENSCHQMRRAAQQEIEMIRQQAGSNQQALHDHVQVRLQQLQQEKQMQQQVESRIARLSEDNRQLQIELQEVQKAAEGQVAYVG